MAGNLPQSGVSLVAEGVSSFLGDINRAQRALTDFGDVPGRVGRGFSGMGEIVTGALREVGAMATQALAEAGRALAGFVTDSIGTAGDFEQTLSVMGATSGATAAELAAVGQRAKELGADLTLPATSANEAAEVMLELNKAGLSVQEAMDAARGSLQLAAAAQTDGATAAGIMSGALNAFELEATDAVRVADLLAAGANASSASMTDLGQGLQQAGFAFHAAGLPVEDLVTSLAALTNVGLTGSDAGTALKNALMRLMNPTKKAAELMAQLGFTAYDATGQMKPLPTLIADLNRSLAGMTDEERNAALGTIFLSDGMKAMIPLLELGDDGFLKLKDAVTEQGAAADVAAAQMQGWNGAMAGIQSQVENLQLVIGQQLLPLLTPLAFKVAELIGSFTGLVERFATMIPTIQSSAEPFRALMAALVILNPSLIGVTGLLLGLYDTFAPLIVILQEAGVGSATFAVALSDLLGPLGVTASAIMTGVGALAQIGAALQSVAGTLMGQFSGATSTAGQNAGALATVFLTVALPAIATIATWFAANLPTAIAAAQAAFQTVGAFIASLMPTIQSIVTLALAAIQSFWQQHGDSVLHIVTNLFQAIQGVIQIVLGVVQGIIAMFYAAITGDTQTALQTIYAANETIWNGIRTFLGGILQAIAGLFGTSLEGIVGLWSSNFRTLAEIANLLMQRASGFIQPQLNAISGAFSAIRGAIDSAVGAIRRFIDAASKIKVPSLVTPGSPTPLELGLRGIDKAASRAARTFEATFSPALASVPAMPSLAAATAPANITTNTSYTMPIYTNQSPAVLRQSLAVVEALSI